MTRRIWRVIGRACVISVSAAVAVMVATPARASAQATLSGCYVPNSGTVYRIKASGLPDACRSKQHVEFTWSLQGPAGPPDLEGKQARKDRLVPPAASRRHGVVVITMFTSVLAPGATGTAQPECPVGKIATGGGYETSNELNPVQLLGSRPVAKNSVPFAWTATVRNPGPNATLAQVYVISPRRMTLSSAPTVDAIPKGQPVADLNAQSRRLSGRVVF